MILNARGIRGVGGEGEAIFNHDDMPEWYKAEMCSRCRCSNSFKWDVASIFSRDGGKWQKSILKHADDV